MSARGRCPVDAKTAGAAWETAPAALFASPAMIRVRRGEGPGKYATDGPRLDEGRRPVKRMSPPGRPPRYASSRGTPTSPIVRAKNPPVNPRGRIDGRAEFGPSRSVGSAPIMGRIGPWGQGAAARPGARKPARRPPRPTGGRDPDIARKRSNPRIGVRRPARQGAVSTNGASGTSATIAARSRSVNRPTRVKIFTSSLSQSPSPSRSPSSRHLGPAASKLERINK